MAKPVKESEKFDDEKSTAPLQSSQRPETTGSAPGTLIVLLLGALIGTLVTCTVFLKAGHALMPVVPSTMDAGECGLQSSMPSASKHARTLQPNTDQPPAPSRSQAMHLLMNWFTENGGTLHPNVELRPRVDQPNEWGFFAKGLVPDGHVLLGVPQHMFITAAGALQSLVEIPHALQALSTLKTTITPRMLMETLGFTSRFLNLEAPDDLDDSDTQDLQVAAIALYIAAHFHDTTHFFYPYFATLPHGCQSAICWPEERLRSTFVPSQVEMIMFERGVFTGVADRLGLDHALFLEKVSMVKSRYWKDPSMEDMPTVVPVADMINHPPFADDTFLTFLSPGVEGSYLRRDGNEAVAGDEIYASYGDKDNGILLREYGFMMKENPDDTCEDLQELLLDDFIAKNIKLPNGCAPCEPRE
eukprot:gb/GEZN01004614.1/.p1 GENE.gb/GEZN01004614.1/~~gb/GEZN01004614.1/.p1  ORF type:complete len:416 (-),score=60.76 gb/GEZN01004614.1/:552-1799(-)